MADSELMIDIVEEGLPAIALVVFVGVRIVGNECLRMPFSWSFGRNSTEYNCP